MENQQIWRSGRLYSKSHADTSQALTSVESSLRVRCNRPPSRPRRPRIQVPRNPFISSRLAICRYNVTKANTISQASSASEKMAPWCPTSSCIQTCRVQARLRMKVSRSYLRRKIVITRCNQPSESAWLVSSSSVAPWVFVWTLLHRLISEARLVSLADHARCAHR